MADRKDLPWTTNQWLIKNWKWAIPVGFVSVVLVCSGCLTAFYIGGYNALQNATPLKDAREIASRDEFVIEQLGSPLKTGLLDDDDKIENTNWKFDVPIEGPKGKGEIYVHATFNKQENAWTLQEVNFRSEDHPDWRDLLKDGPVEIKLNQ